MAWFCTWSSSRATYGVDVTDVLSPDSRECFGAKPVPGRIDNMHHVRMGAIFGVVAVLVLALLSAPAGAASKTHTLNGRLTLHDAGGWFPPSGGDTSCTGPGGYSDIGRGAQVRITDGSGKLLALGALNQGILDLKNFTGRAGTFVEDCFFGFIVKKIPERKFYGIEVSHRGVINYTLSQFKHAKWQVQLTLGS